jgi:hypothetical protein
MLLGRRETVQRWNLRTRRKKSKKRSARKKKAQNAEADHQVE